jgi:prophage antirepressor-like protein
MTTASQSAQTYSKTVWRVRHQLEKLVELWFVALELAEAVGYHHADKLRWSECEAGVCGVERCVGKVHSASKGQSELKERE